MKVYKRSSCIHASHDKNYRQSIMAAGEDDSFDTLTDDQLEDDSFEDSIDNLSDQVEDLQDSIDDVDDDPVTIDTDNNISNHYIAECDNCHGIFISAVVESDQEVNSISGICPLCEKETSQLLKWVVRDVNDETE